MIYEVRDLALGFPVVTDPKSRRFGIFRLNQDRERRPPVPQEGDCSQHQYCVGDWRERTVSKVLVLHPTRFSQAPPGVTPELAGYDPENKTAPPSKLKIKFLFLPLAMLLLVPGSCQRANLAVLIHFNLQAPGLLPCASPRRVGTCPVPEWQGQKNG